MCICMCCSSSCFRKITGHSTGDNGDKAVRKGQKDREVLEKMKLGVTRDHAEDPEQGVVEGRGDTGSFGMNKPRQ